MRNATYKQHKEHSLFNSKYRNALNFSLTAQEPHNEHGCQLQSMRIIKCKRILLSKNVTEFVSSYCNDRCQYSAIRHRIDWCIGTIVSEGFLAPSFGTAKELNGSVSHYIFGSHSSANKYSRLLGHYTP